MSQGGEEGRGGERRGEEGREKQIGMESKKVRECCERKKRPEKH